MRLTDTQRAVLSELAHMRVSPEDAILSTERLGQLVGAPRVLTTLRSLKRHGLVENTDPEKNLWRLTDRGRLTPGGSQ